MAALIANIRRRPIAVVLGVIVLIALLLRLPGLDYCMAPDESFTFTNNIIKGLDSVLFGPYLAGNHMLTSLLVWAMYNLFGDHDWAFQLPTLALGLATVLAAYPVGTLLFQNRGAGLAASFFFAWAPFPVAYSTNARGYCPMFLFILFSAAFLYLNLQKPAPLRWLGLVLSTFLMGLSHLSSLVVFAAWGAVIGVYALYSLIYRPKRSWRRIVSCVAAGAALMAGLALIHVAYSPVFLLFHGVMGRAFRGAWPTDISTFLAGAEQVWQPFWNYTDALTGLRGSFFWTACALAIFGTALSLRRGAYGALVSLAGITAPAAALIVFHLRIEPRYTLFLLPFCVLSMAAGAALFAEMAGAGIVAAGEWIAEKWRNRSAFGPEGAAGVDFDQFPARRRLVVSVVVFCLVAGFLARGTLPLYTRNFPYYAPPITCVLADTKSAAQYVGERVTRNDIFSYPRFLMHPVEHYAERYVYPSLSATPWPPRNLTVWLISSEIGKDPREEGYTLPFTRKAVFYGCSVWACEVTSPALRKIALPPFAFKPGVQMLESLDPWSMSTWEFMEPMELELAENISDPAERTLFVTPTSPTWHWELFSPLEPCHAHRMAFIRGEIRAMDTSRRGVGLCMRFFDAERKNICEWPIRVPAKKDFPAPSSWRTFQLGVFSPPGTCFVSAGLEITTPVHPFIPVGFRRVELWLEAGGG